MFALPRAKCPSCGAAFPFERFRSLGGILGVQDCPACRAAFQMAPWYRRLLVWGSAGASLAVSILLGFGWPWFVFVAELLWVPVAFLWTNLFYMVASPPFVRYIPSSGPLIASSLGLDRKSDKKQETPE